MVPKDPDPIQEDLPIELADNSSHPNTNHPNNHPSLLCESSNTILQAAVNPPTYTNVGGGERIFPHNNAADPLGQYFFSPHHGFPSTTPFYPRHEVTPPTVTNTTGPRISDGVDGFTANEAARYGYGYQGPPHAYHGFPLSFVSPTSSAGRPFYNGQGFPTPYMYNHPAGYPLAQHQNQPSTMAVDATAMVGEEPMASKGHLLPTPGKHSSKKPSPPTAHQDSILDVAHINDSEKPVNGAATANDSAPGNGGGALSADTLRQLMQNIDTTAGDEDVGSNSIARRAIVASTRRDREKTNEFYALLEFMRKGGLSGSDQSLMKLAEMVPDPEQGPGAEEVCFIVSLRNQPPLAGSLVVQTVNQIIVSYFKYLVRKKKEDGKRAFKPIYVLERLKKIFSVFTEHGITVGIGKHLVGFRGSLEEVSKIEFKTAKEEDPTYDDPVKYELTDDDFNKITAFLKSDRNDLSDPVKMMKTVAFVSLYSYLLRGAGELSSLTWPKVLFGVHATNHPRQGERFVGLHNFADKTHAMSLSMYRIVRRCCLTFTSS